MSPDSIKLRRYKKLLILLIMLIILLSAVSLYFAYLAYSYHVTIIEALEALEALVKELEVLRQEIEANALANALTIEEIRANAYKEAYMRVFSAIVAGLQYVVYNILPPLIAPVPPIPPVPPVPPVYFHA